MLLHRLGIAGAAMLVSLGSLGAQPTLDDLFDDRFVHDIRIIIHPGDFARLVENYLTNDYYPCTLQWRDQIWDYVGIRSRGLGSRNQKKPGLRVDANRYEDIKILGASSFILDNITQDPTMMKERLAFALFRRLGQPAPRMAPARLFINDEFIGLYSIIESIDKDYLKRHLGEDSGYLY